MPFSLSSSALNDYQRYLSLLVGNAAYVDTIPLTVDYLVIAGGGGGAFVGAGGGAGGYRTSAGTSGGGASAETTLTLAADTNYTVTVGAGGPGNISSSPVTYSKGANSVFSTITSEGGGGGGGVNAFSGGNGGSGGGGWGDNPSGTIPGTGAANQGYGGGAGGNYTSAYGEGAGGGGGAGAAGAAGISGSIPNGGIGVQSSIAGSAVYYAGGGGGYGSQNAPNNHTGGAGGTGGGGAGGYSSASYINGTSGTANTGGGGGGSSYINNLGTIGTAGNGGSGVVILKYPIAYDMTVGAGLGYKTVMYGDYKITEFTSGTGTVSFAAAPTVVGSGEDILQEIVLEESASSVTFANLDQYASTYQHLQIRITARSTSTSTNQNGRVFFNGDETYIGGNYYTHLLEGNGSSVSSDNGNYNAPFQLPGDSILPLDMFSASVIDILDFSSSSKNTTVRALSGWPGSSGGGAVTRIYLRSMLWNNTNAVTSMKIVDGTGFRIGSRFTLIGVK